VRSAIGLATANVTVLDPDLYADTGEAVSGGALATVLDPGVAGGSLAGFGRGDIAVSTQEAGAGGMGAHLGQMVTVYLADGTPYRARLTATYSRSLGFGDVLIPAAVAAGHLGPQAFTEILIRGTGAVRPAALAAELSRLSGRFPGLSVASRSVVNAQAQRQNAQDSFMNNLILLVVALLAGVSLVTTLVVATVERRESILLLRRVGATWRQLTSMTAWQSVVMCATGVLLGSAAAAATLVSVSRALTGNWMPYLTVTPVLAIVGVVLAAAMAATLGPAALILRGARGSG
jgi:putative ABC transport system permease protein